MSWHMQYDLCSLHHWLEYRSPLLLAINSQHMYKHVDIIIQLEHAVADVLDALLIRMEDAHQEVHIRRC